MVYSDFKGIEINSAYLEIAYIHWYTSVSHFTIKCVNILNVAMHSLGGYWNDIEHGRNNRWQKFLLSVLLKGDG